MTITINYDFEKRLICKVGFCIISRWQHFGNSKSVSQNNICNRDKITAKIT